MLTQLPPQQGPEVALQARPLATQTALGVAVTAPQKPPPSAAGWQTLGEAQFAAVAQPPLTGLTGHGVAHVKLLGSQVKPVQHWAERQDDPAETHGGGTPEHAPKLQLSPMGQAFPQTPQLLGSLRVLVHKPAQQTSPDAHEPQPPVEQTPPAQIWPATQVLPQAPQSVGLVFVSTQTPRQTTSRAGQPLEPLPLLEPVLPFEPLLLPDPRTQAHCQLPFSHWLFAE